MKKEIRGRRGAVLPASNLVPLIASLNEQQSMYALRALNLAGTQASGTYIDMAGSALDDCLDTLYIGLPGSVGCSVGVRYLVAECHALTANCTLCHETHLLQMIQGLPL